MTADQTLFAPINRGIIVGDTVRQKGQSKLMTVLQFLPDENQLVCGWPEYDQATLQAMAKFAPDELELVRYGKS